MTAHRSVKLDLPISDAARAPGEGVGMLALEGAMDELAEKLGLDPIELRMRNEPAMDPEKKLPYSTRQLVRCMTEGAERFGWSRRSATPASRREGRWLIGMGMSASTRSNNKSATLGALAGAVGLQADGEIKAGDMAKKFSQQAYGAHFAEVAVDMDTGEIRLRRMLGVFAAGRILNQKTATSQAMGAMIWGVGNALHEEAVVDPRHGFFVNHDLAQYHVPVHADIPAIEVRFLHEVDDKANPLKIKGIGELGICVRGPRWRMRSTTPPGCGSGTTR